ncbi:hypothetical protein O6H91_08G010000 [Diphasiastrum complanatum]|nr:hypothetical protein O6H91_08G010000 [Diphasiastrum complanatum]KAJ7545783.1 hypothetical protein O6H91_08G010000 [Diphasiastrum complanatum]KAJ7545784.1 hypothetical protein O6H91_08G010000 [Diphasiastrum complanatum]KAJ7545786.1 hypothetical protein O6H91_08G010000 [Diphasiastrum complanatum]
MSEGARPDAVSQIFMSDYQDKLEDFLGGSSGISQGFHGRFQHGNEDESFYDQTAASLSTESQEFTYSSSPVDSMFKDVPYVFPACSMIESELFPTLIDQHEISNAIQEDNPHPCISFLHSIPARDLLYSLEPRNKFTMDSAFSNSDLDVSHDSCTFDHSSGSMNDSPYLQSSSVTYDGHPRDMTMDECALSELSLHLYNESSQLNTSDLINDSQILNMKNYYVQPDVYSNQVFSIASSGKDGALPVEPQFSFVGNLQPQSHPDAFVVKEEATDLGNKVSSGDSDKAETYSIQSAEKFGQRTSKYRGVTKHRWTHRFEAHLWDSSYVIKKDGKSRKGRQVYLGGYDKEEIAARAYDLAALKYWGPDAIINFPLSTYRKELKEMKDVTKQEFVASLRRKSSGFSRGASKYRGVTRHHQQGRWQARIGRVAGHKDLYLGTYSTEEEAAQAYDRAAIKYRGVRAITNFEMSKYIDVPSDDIKSSTIEIYGQKFDQWNQNMILDSANQEIICTTGQEWHTFLEHLLHSQNNEVRWYRGEHPNQNQLVIDNRLNPDYGKFQSSLRTCHTLLDCMR